MTEHTTIDTALVIDTFLLLLIGIGPKIALVPFLEATDGMDGAMKARVTRKMLTTAGVVSLVLIGLGELLTQLLHFSTGSLSVASGIVLLIIAVSMILSRDEAQANRHDTEGQDPMRLAVYPLAVPYLLNPAGIVTLVTLSADAESIAVFAMVVGIVAVVLTLDAVVFRWANRISDHLDPSRMLVTEKVFGFLLAALAVQLALNGLADVGAIQLNDH